MEDVHVSQREAALLKKKDYAGAMLMSRGNIKTLNKTVNGMLSPSVRARMIAKLQQCLIRVIKACEYLLGTINQRETGADRSLLAQIGLMLEYAAVLDVRIDNLPPGVQ